MVKIKKKRTKKPLKKPLKKPQNVRHTKWEDKFIILGYEFAKQGWTDTRIGKALGVSSSTFKKWRLKKPIFKYAIERGREGPQTGDTFRDYMYGRLPEELQDLWDRIEKSERNPSSWSRVRAMLEDRGKEVRQSLFLYALVASNFSATDACRKVGISPHTMRDWIEKDENFRELVDEIHIAKKDFFESSLIELVRDGDRAAVIFANKTFNRDRGYADKQEIKHEHTGKIEHQMNLIDLDALRLPVSVRVAILDAIERKELADARGEEVPALEDHSNVIEADFEAIEEEEPMEVEVG